MQLTLENLSKSFGKNKILYDFNTTFTPGIYGLLGPNGAGKTTLMNILTNTSLPTKGKVLWDNKDITRCGDAYRNIIGYLPQDVGLYPHFTARYFLKYIAALKGVDDKHLMDKIEEVANLVNLSDVLDKKCGKFSGGMKRRLGVAQALINNPKLLILDEPTAGLDPIERIRFRNLISDIASDRIVIISTHIVSDIDRIAKNIILMDKGRIIANKCVEMIINDIEGMVWEARVPSTYLNEMEKTLKIVTAKQEDSQIILRIVSKVRPISNAVQVLPNIEDVYMYYFQDYKGRREE